MTPRYRWIPIISQSAFGLFVGVFSACFLALVFDFGLQMLFGGLPHLVNLMCIFAICCVPIVMAIGFAFEETRRQRIEHRADRNQCVQCGYSLTGIRSTSNQCPECGKIFRKWA
jgi:hypothetical protein